VVGIRRSVEHRPALCRTLAHSPAVENILQDGEGVAVHRPIQGNCRFTPRLLTIPSTASGSRTNSPTLSSSLSQIASRILTIQGRSDALVGTDRSDVLVGAGFLSFGAFWSIREFKDFPNRDLFIKKGISRTSHVGTH
jgi:hypothetical protein